MKKIKRASGLQQYFGLFILTIIVIMVGIHFLINSILISTFLSKVEKETVESKMDNAVKLWDHKIERLSAIAKDYAVWTQMYEHMVEGVYDDGFFEENFTEWLGPNFGVDMVLIIDKNCNVVRSQGMEDEFSKNIMSMEKCGEMIRESGNGKSCMDVSGYVRYKSNLYVVSIAPVLRSDYTGSPAGILFIADKVDDEMVEGMKEQSGTDIFFADGNGIIASSKQARQVLNENLKIENKISLMGEQKLRDNVIRESHIHDIFGEDIASFGIVESRGTFENIESLIMTGALIALLLSMALVVGASERFRAQVISPIKMLEQQVEAMSSENMLVKIKQAGPSEVVSLARTFNDMVEKIAKSKEQNRRLRTVTQIDELTGLYNHRYFHEMFENKIDVGIKQISLLFCDVDRLGNINSAYGYEIGDMLLIEIAAHITDNAPSDALVFRYGGEEFVVMLAGKDSQNALAAAERIRRGIARSDEIQKYSDHMPVTVSVGIAAYPVDSTSSHGLVQKGEIAMQYSKQMGRNNVSIYSKEIESQFFRDRSEFSKKEMLIDSVLALTKAIDAKDCYTGKHSDNVAKYSLLLAERLGFSEEELQNLRIGALLHDCGKIGIPDMIINKPFRLDEDENEYITKHPILGYNIVKNIIDDEDVLSCVRYHHEKWDGSGYPDGLSGEEIPLYARIVCIADSFHAMISDRPYRKALSVEEAVFEIEKNANIQFDPKLAHVFAYAVREDAKNTV